MSTFPINGHREVGAPQSEVSPVVETLPAIVNELQSKYRDSNQITSADRQADFEQVEKLYYDFVGFANTAAQLPGIVGDATSSLEDMSTMLQAIVDVARIIQRQERAPLTKALMGRFVARVDASRALADWRR